jgi:hypothetical protein
VETMRRQKAIETLPHARIVVNDSYGAHAIAHPFGLAGDTLSNGKRSFSICEHMTPLEWQQAPKSICGAFIVF